MTNATLGFQIDSSQASSAAADLDKLTAAAARTQQAADKLEAEARGLGTAFGAAGAGAGKALPSVDSLGKKLMQQDEHVRSFRMEVERLTLKYQPLARATQSYEASVSEINRAHQLGVINAQQMQKALDAERMSFERLKTSATAAGSAVKAANSNSGAQRAGAVNAGFQIQDTVTSALGGSSIGMITGQQGFQLAGALSSMERPVAGLASAFASLLNPVSLISLGLVAGTAALVQYFNTADEGTGKTSKLFEEQNESIRRAAELWGDAVPAFKAYVDELDRADKLTQGKAAGEILGARELEGLSEKLSGIEQQGIKAFRALRGDPGNDVVVRDLRTAWGELKDGLDDGSASMAQLNAVQRELTTAATQYGVPAVLDFKDAFDQNTDSIYRSIEAAKEARSAYLTALSGGTNVQDIVAGSYFTDNGRRYRPSDFTPANAPTPSRRPLRELEGDGSETGPAMITNSDGLLVNVPIPGRKPNFFEIEQTKEKVDDLEKAYRRAQEAKADFWLDMGFSERQSERSAIDQRIATTLNRYGFDENMKSPEANALRQQYQREEQKTFIKGFFSDIYSEAWANGGNIGKAIVKSALNAAQEAMGKAWDSLFDKLASGISSLLFGDKGGASLVSSGGGGLLSSAASSVFANDNKVSSTGSAVDLASGLLGKNERTGRTDINSFLKKGGVDIDAAQTAWCAAFVNSSLEQVGVDGSGSLVANSFQKWGKAVDPSSVLRGDVLLQSRGLGAGQPGGHVGFATGASRMLGGQKQLEMLSGNQSNSVSNAWVNASELQVRRATEAADALGSLASSSGAATKGLGQLGQSLSSSFFPAAPSAGGGGGGGLFSWLGGLFGGGGNPALSKYKGLTGLFANGTNYAPGGMAIVGEQGPELVDLPQGSKVFSNGKSNQMMGMAANGNEAGPSQLNVSILGASGDNHIRMLVQQGVAEALAAKNEQDRRGGFGAMQARYSSQKG